MTENRVESTHVERLLAVHLQALRLVEQLHTLAAIEQPEELPYVHALIDQVQEVVEFAAGGSDRTAPGKKPPAPTLRQLQEFGTLLGDKRNAAGLSRTALARKAKISDATIKFTETARHPPSRATLLRLISVAELRLSWSDAPGTFLPPAHELPILAARPQVVAELNCLIPATFDPLHMVTELGRVLNGAGGHVEQTNAYLDYQSAAGYLALIQKSAVAASLRASTPLAEAARRIIAATGLVGLNVIALGSGDAALEVRLVQHLLAEARAPSIELCLLDISQPLLVAGQKHAAATLTDIPNVHVWGMQCHFHDLPFYGKLVYGGDKRPARRRVLCMLGGTFANVDNEPRFFQHALPHCARGDLLLLDLQLARSAAGDPDEIKKRDPQWAVGVTAGEATWLSGPIWRHCKDVVKVDFHWNLDSHCPLPGSYALGAIATVERRSGAARQFSMFRFRRYAPDKLAECLRGFGWDELGAWPLGVLSIHHRCGSSTNGQSHCYVNSAAGFCCPEVEGVSFLTSFLASSRQVWADWCKLCPAARSSRSFNPSVKIMTPARSSRFTNNRRLRRQTLWGTLVLWAVAILPLSVAAEPLTNDGGPVLLWGIQRGCDVDPSAERAVRERLQSFAGSQLHRLQRVEVPADAESRNCLGEQCAQLFRKACPEVSGQLIGGEIDDLVLPDPSGKGLVSRLRLWRHDLGTQRTFYQSRLCTRGLCGDQPIAETVAQMAAQLLERSGFEADARPFSVVRAERLPLCGTDGGSPLGTAPPATDRSKSVERLYQQIYLALVIDPVIADQQRSIQDLFVRALPLLKLDGFREHPLHVEVRALDSGAPDAAWVQRIQAAATAGRTLAERKLPARFLVLQIGKRGDALTLDFHWLPSSDSEAREYDFPAAGYGPQAPLTLGLMEVNALAATLRNERAAQLGRLRTPVAGRPAADADACQPMPAPRCAEITLAATAVGAASSAPAPALAPKLAQGALWGVFAASTVTFIALTALDQAHVGDLTVDGTRAVGGSLRAGMGVSGGIAALALGLAIPTTVLFRQNPAQPARQVARSSGTCRLLRANP